MACTLLDRVAPVASLSSPDSRRPLRSATMGRLFETMNPMRFRHFPILALLCLPLSSLGQTSAHAPYQIFGGFSALSNSFNGLPGSHSPLIGWDAAVAFPAWHNVRFKLDVSGFNGENLGAPQNAFFIMGGAQYDHAWHRERLFAHALFGDGGLNRNWGPNGALGGTASFAVLLGGGVDTPISPHFAFRVEGDMQHTNFALIQSRSNPVPYRIPGLPTYFGRFTTGIVWTPRLASSNSITNRTPNPHGEPADSEVIFESLNSFGHYHIFAYSWWSYLNVAGVEYDRPAWGRFLGAQMDYVAEILPIAILRQPSKTDVFGDPLTTEHKTVAGIGISPIGLRLIWRNGKEWKPYYTIKAGMIGFDEKALSEYASYEDFTLQQSIGMQFRMTNRWDFRAGISDFHFSNAFMVPNNPGIDEMAYNVGLSLHFKTRPLHF